MKKIFETNDPAANKEVKMIDSLRPVEFNWALIYYYSTGSGFDAALLGLLFGTSYVWAVTRYCR